MKDLITGEMLIGSIARRGTQGSLRAFDPAADREIDPPFGLGGAAEVNEAALLADAAFDVFRTSSLASRADFLDRIADLVADLGAALPTRAAAETGLSIAQLTWEHGATVSQLRKFATVVRHGNFLRATVDPARAAQEGTAARMDHRMQKVAIGPVAIFGASNFPMSYSVAGGDTAAAFAAGCPVIVKAHNAHPGTSEMVGRAVRQAVRDCGMPEGVFSLVFGAGNAIGESLVDHPLVKAVTFTGSEGGGMALYRRAQLRPDPIPVFTEMTSVNPNFVLPAALAARGAEIGRAFMARMVAAVGQACLKPAILVAVDAGGFDALRAAMVEVIAPIPARTMLTPGICQAYRQGVARQAGAGAQQIAAGSPAQRTWDGQAVLFEATGSQVLADASLTQEVFGPAALLVRCDSAAQMTAVVQAFRGQLSAALHLDDADMQAARQLLPLLERRTGRIVVNSFSHPQEVSDASIHGGPFPATSDSRFTSVGMSSIERFLRPVCYQGFPDALLPDALKQANPRAIWRVVDGMPCLPCPLP